MQEWAVSNFYFEHRS